LKCVYGRSTARFEIPLKEYPLEVVKYAAFSLTGDAFAHIFLKPARVVAAFETKSPATRKSLGRLAADFKDALKLEAIRSDIAGKDQGLREHIVRLALRGEPVPVEDASAGLSAQQQKELDRLIAEVEAEIAKESTGKSPDPLGVTKTWEAAHGHDGKGPAKQKK